MILKKHRIPIYGGQLWVCVSKSFKGAIEELEDKLIDVQLEQNKDDLRTMRASSYQFYNHEGKFRVIVLIKPHATIDDIAHESLHILNWIFVHSHIKYDLKNDEPQCYLMGWLTERIWKARNSK